MCGSRLHRHDDCADGSMCMQAREGGGECAGVYQADGCQGSACEHTGPLLHECPHVRLPEGQGEAGRTSHIFGCRGQQTGLSWMDSKWYAAIEASCVLCNLM